MVYASPFVELLGFIASVLICTGSLVAAVIFLREKGAGPVAMLTGSILSLIGLIPPALNIFVNFNAQKGYEPPEIPQFMYYALWDALPLVSAFIFIAGLLIVALGRRGLANRIAELERILSVRDSENR